MRIFTYQHPIVLDTINEKGIYTPFSLQEKNDFLRDCINDPHGFIQSYAWLRIKMIERNITSIGEIGDLIWGWGLDNSFNATNLRYKQNRVIYDNHILLELEIPENRLCATCYTNWHNILNNGPIANIEADYDEACSSQEATEKTWENVFNIEFNKDDLSDKFEPHIQYTFFQILKTDLISIKKIKNQKVVFSEKVKK